MWIWKGLVASGKTSFLTELSRHTNNFDVLYECVPDFCKFGNFNPLHEAYADPVLNAAIAQLHILDCIHKQLYNVSPWSFSRLISERSLYSPLVFNAAHRRVGTITAFVEAFISHEVRRRAPDTKVEAKVSSFDHSENETSQLHQH